MKNKVSPLQFSSPLKTIAPIYQIGVLVLIAFIGLYWASVTDLVHHWNTQDTYSHGILIVLLSLYLLMTRNKRLVNISIEPSAYFLVPLLATSLVWLAASITDTKTLELSALPVILLLTYASIIGIKATYLVAAPLLLILLVIPIWNILIPLLQIMAVFFNQHALALTGIPTFIDGVKVSIPAGNFEIEDGCSGIRFLMVSVALSAYYSILNFKRVKPALIVIGISIVFAILLNWIRIYSIILIGHFTDMQSSLVNDHDMLGWIMFTVGLIPLYFVVQKNTKKYELSTVDARAEPTEKTDNNNIYPSNRRSIAIIIVVGIGLISFGLINNYLKNRALDTFTTLSAPKAVSPWAGPISYTGWKPNFHNASIEVASLYVGTKGYTDIVYHIFYYGKQDQDAELINSENTIAEKHKIISTRTVINGNQPIIETIITNGLKRRLVWHWYNIDNKKIVKPLLAKLYQAKELFTGVITSKMIAISLNCKISCDQQRQNLDAFLRLNKL